MKKTTIAKARKNYGLALFAFQVLVLCGQSCVFAEEPLNWLQLLTGDARRHFYFSRPEREAGMSEKRRARDTLVNIIDRAGESVELWCYGLDEPLVIDALARARERGIAVSILGDPDTNYDEAGAAGLNVAPRDKSGIQHVKLVLIDRRIIFSGTGNFTTSGFFYNNNAFFHLFVDQTTADRIARALSFETEPAPPIDTPFAGRLFFAPRQGRLIQKRLIQAILSARGRIRFKIFSFTDPLVAAALYMQARKGIQIEGIFDDEYGRQIFDPESRAFALNQNLGLHPSALYLDGNFEQFEKRPGEFHGGHLHHKTIIVDDSRVLTGSYNWSNSARDRNLEVFFDFKDIGVAARFNEEFERIRSRALLQGRAPVALPPELESIPALLGQGETFCPGAHPNHTPGFHVFAGRGPYFRALSFAPANETSERGRVQTAGRDERRCFSAGENSANAGLPRKGTYPLFSNPDSGEADDGTGWLEPPAYTYNLRHSRFDIPADSLPCEDPRACEFLTLKRIDPGDGWIWIETNDTNDSGQDLLETPTELRLWSRDGFSDWLELNRVTADFYTFAGQDSKGDMIVFTRDASGSIRIGCVQSGKSLDATPAYFMDAITAERDRFPECLMRES